MSTSEIGYLENGFLLVIRQKFWQKTSETRFLGWLSKLEGALIFYGTGLFLDGAIVVLMAGKGQLYRPAFRFLLEWGVF